MSGDQQDRELLEALDEAIRAVVLYRHERDGVPQGVVTAWEVTLSETRYDDDGDAEHLVMGLCPSSQPTWQSIGLLRVGEQAHKSWLFDPDCECGDA